jgi:hypothetical protein
MRRIKSMSLSIPCVTGPYTSVSAKLTLQNSRIRKNADLINGGYAEQMNDENPSSILDPRFTSGIARVESIATSSGQNDSGMFELNFRDERYLPFEGAGVISQWKLELPNEFRQFDYDTISDVILHVRYTAKDGGDTFKDNIETSLAESFENMVVQEGRTGLFHLFSAKQDLAQQWLKFTNLASNEGNDNSLSFIFEQLQDRLPFVFRNRKDHLQLNCIKLFLKLKDELGSVDIW